MHCARKHIERYSFLAFFLVCRVSTSWAQSELRPVSVTPQLRTERHLADFYAKSVAVDGLLVLGSERVADAALLEASYLTNQMLSGAPQVRKALADVGLRITVMAADEFTTDVPEHRDLKPKEYWNRRARGLGGTLENPVVSCGEENLLEYAGDPYAGENILIHEFSHAVHLIAMARIDATFDVRLKDAFNSAIEKGLWKNTYAASNHEEYFAEGSQSWFSCNAPPGKVHGDVRTRNSVRKYDPELASLLAEVYGENSWQYVPPSARCDAAGAPRVNIVPRAFKWPKAIENLDDLPSPK